MAASLSMEPVLPVSQPAGLLSVNVELAGMDAFLRWG